MENRFSWVGPEWQKDLRYQDNTLTTEVKLIETPALTLFPEKVAWLYRQSLLILNTQIDWQGGILAANDSDVIQFNRAPTPMSGPGMAPLWPMPWIWPATR